MKRTVILSPFPIIQCPNFRLDLFVILISVNAVGRIAPKSRKTFRAIASKLEQMMSPLDLSESQQQIQTITFVAASKDF